MKKVTIIHFIIRVIAYYALCLLTIFCEGNGIINGLILFPVLILLFEIIFLQIRHKKVNLWVIFRETGAKEIAKNVMAIAVSIVVFFGLAALTVLIIWYSSTPHQLKINSYWNQFKTIYFVNNTGKPVYVTVNFRYTEEELEEYSITIDNEYFNRIDTFLLREPYNKSIIMHLPIKEFDSIPFPKKFKFSVLDSTCTNVLQELDFDEFIEFTKKESAIKYNNPLVQDRWQLHIDSIINSKKQ